MLNPLLESLRKKSILFAALPETVRIPGHGGKPSIDGLHLAAASVDDLAFAIQGLDQEITGVIRQLSALKCLHDQARIRGALGTDTVGMIFGQEV